jgi:hypothetical protein
VAVLAHLTAVPRESQWETLLLARLGTRGHGVSASSAVTVVGMFGGNPTRLAGPVTARETEAGRQRSPPTCTAANCRGDRLEAQPGDRPLFGSEVTITLLVGICRGREVVWCQVRLRAFGSMTSRPALPGPDCRRTWSERQRPCGSRPGPSGEAVSQLRPLCRSHCFKRPRNAVGSTFGQRPSDPDDGEHVPPCFYAAQRLGSMFLAECIGDDQPRPWVNRHCCQHAYTVRVAEAAGQDKSAAISLPPCLLPISLPRISA